MLLQFGNAQAALFSTSLLICGPRLQLGRVFCRQDLLKLRKGRGTSQ